MSDKDLSNMTEKFIKDRDKAAAARPNPLRDGIKVPPTNPLLHPSTKKENTP